MSNYKNNDSEWKIRGKIDDSSQTVFFPIDNDHDNESFYTNGGCCKSTTLLYSNSSYESIYNKTISNILTSGGDKNYYYYYYKNKQLYNSNSLDVILDVIKYDSGIYSLRLTNNTGNDIYYFFSNPSINYTSYFSKIDNVYDLDTDIRFSLKNITLNETFNNIYSGSGYIYNSIVTGNKYSMYELEVLEQASIKSNWKTLKSNNSTDLISTTASKITAFTLICLPSKQWILNSFSNLTPKFYVSSDLSSPYRKDYTKLSNCIYQMMHGTQFNNFKYFFTIQNDFNLN
jgi:uncharacterized protein (DUF779 family)